MSVKKKWVLISTLFSVGSLGGSACKHKLDSSTKASDADRALIGLAKNYIPDYECDGLHPITGKPLADPAALFDEDPATLRRNGSQRAAFTEKLANSMRERRKFGWCVAQKAFWPTGIPTSENSQSINPIPTWLTWFEAFEFEAIFTSLYAEQKKSQNKDFPLITDELITAAFAKRIEDIKKNGIQRDTESFERDLREKAPIPGVPATQLETTALGGRGFTLFSPAYVRHLIKNYESIARCKINTNVQIPAVFGLPRPSNDQNFSAPCLAEEFPPEAVMAKAVWLPIEAQGKKRPITYFGSDEKTIKALFSSSNYAWSSSAAGNAEASDRDILTQIDKKGKKFGLVALHFTTKETRDWVWTTYWWSPAQAKNAEGQEIGASMDFGADRIPIGRNASDRAITDHYKMCVTSTFSEKANLDQEYGEEAKKSPAIASLLAAMKAADVGVNTPPKLANGEVLKWDDDGQQRGTWCSNPYIETHPGNSHTNCIGCHQHASSGVTFNQTFYLGTPEREWTHFPKYGATRVRNTHPSDFSWGYEMEFMRFINQTVSNASTAK